MSYPLLRFLGSVARSNLGSLERPYKLNFAVTYQCQSRCLTCNIWKMRPEGELTLDEIKVIAENNPVFKWVQLTGGEPFLRKDIFEIAEAFVEHSNPYILSIPTNSLCSPDMIAQKVEEIAKLPVPRFALTLSLDGYGSLHDRIRGVPGNSEKVMETYSKLKHLKKRKGFLLIFGYTMSKFNEGELDNTIRVVKRRFPEVTADDFHINMAQNSITYYQNQELDITPNPESVVSELKRFWEQKERESAFNLIEYTYLKGLREFAKTKKSPIKTRELDASLFLDSFGNVFPSVMWSRNLGNVRDFSYQLKFIWENELAKIARHMISEGYSPQHWTSCEAYQTILGSAWKLL